MIEPLSQLEKGWRATTIHESEGTDFDRVAKLFRVPRPDGWKISSWRESVQGVGWGPRALYGGVRLFLEGAFKHLEKSKAVTWATANPDRLVSGTNDFTNADIGRDVRISGDPALYRIVDVHGSGSHATLATNFTARWAGASWAADGSGTATIYGFRTKVMTPGPDDHDDHDGYGLLLIEVFESDVGTVPPTYILPRATSTPVGMPNGGHVVPRSDRSNPTNASAGPFPIYLTSRNDFKQLAAVLEDVVAAGIRPVIHRLASPGYFPG